MYIIHIHISITIIFIILIHAFNINIVISYNILYIIPISTCMHITGYHNIYMLINHITHACTQNHACIYIKTLNIPFIENTLENMHNLYKNTIIINSYENAWKILEKQLDYSLNTNLSLTPFHSSITLIKNSFPSPFSFPYTSLCIPQQNHNNTFGSCSMLIYPFHAHSSS